MAEKQASLDEFLKNYEAQNEEDKDLVGSESTRKEKPCEQSVTKCTLDTT